MEALANQATLSEVVERTEELISGKSEPDAQAVAEAKATTFEQAAQAYIRAHRSGWKSPKSLAAWEHTLQDFAYPILGKLPVAAVDTALVLKVIEPPIITNISL